MMKFACESTATNDDNEPQMEVIGDEKKTISFDIHHNKIKHVCILNIDARYTVEVVHGKDSDKFFNEKNQQPTVRYPHDAEEVLKELDPNIIVQTAYLTTNIRQNIGIIRRLKHDVDVFVNLYDTLDDIRSKIIDYMQHQGIAFTGSSLHCCDPSRIEIKRLCRYNQISTPKFALLTDLNKYNDNTLNQLVKKLGGFPLFIKPEHGYDSVGINEKSLVRCTVDMQERCSAVINEFGGVLIEQYIEGREFTVLIIGSRDNIHVFPPTEYQFVDNKTFITFDDKWGSSYTESHWRLMNGEQDGDEQKLIDDLMFSAKRLYQAIDGDGCARIDIRQDKRTKQVFILDYNSNVSLFYKDSCSADFIVKSSGWSKSRFIKFLLEDALERQRQYHLAHSYVVKYSPTHGYGIYASRNLQEGDLIYSHENCSLKLITKTYAQQTYNEHEMVAFNNYAWPLCDNVFVLWHENSDRWQPFNHSCDPNMWMNGLQRVARRPICEGEQLTMDYSTITNTPPDFECWCGASECRRRLKPNEYKEKWFQDRYGSHVNPFIQMLIKTDNITNNNNVLN